MNPIIKEVTAFQVKTDIPPFKVGDGVRVHTKVREGDKERVQVFAGIVIARKGSGIHETFTVRRISYGEGVERVFRPRPLWPMTMPAKTCVRSLSPSLTRVCTLTESPTLNDVCFLICSPSIFSMSFIVVF